MAAPPESPPKPPKPLKKGEFDSEPPTNVTPSPKLEVLRRESSGRLPLVLPQDDDPHEPTAVADAIRNATLPATLDATVEIVSGPAGVGTKFRLTTLETIVGREGAIRIGDPDISRQHASFVWVNEEFRVIDGESVNGTYLNGARVFDYPLRDGDNLLVGSTTLTFRLSRTR